MQGQAVISPDVLARYAADAAREVPGVRGLVESALHRHKGVRVAAANGDVRVEVHLRLDWDASAPDVARAVQARVAEYLVRMANVRPGAVDVVVDEIAPPRRG